MNVERLHAIGRALSAELERTDLVRRLANLESAITNQVNAPQEPTYQQQVAASLAELGATLETAASNAFPAAWHQTLDELGVADILGTALYAQIAEVFSRNQITPSVARDEVTLLSARVGELSTSLSQLLAGLNYFAIGTEDLDPGEAEVGVLIPRPAVKEELSALGAEFGALQKILGPFSELAEGSRPQLKVRAIASSDFAVYLAMAPGAALAVATALDKILEVYKKLLEIRRLRQELADQGMSDDELASIDKRANNLMTEGTESIAQEMVASATLTDAGRANELQIELRLSLNALANRIDQGYNIDVRAEPDAEYDDEEPGSDGDQSSGDQEALLRIRELSPRLAFLNPAGRPILSLPESSASDDGSGPTTTSEAPRQARGRKSE